jgi:hypothetical protein
VGPCGIFSVPQVPRDDTKNDERNRTGFGIQEVESEVRCREFKDGDVLRGGGGD